MGVGYFCALRRKPVPDFWKIFGRIFKLPKPKNDITPLWRIFAVCAKFRTLPAIPPALHKNVLHKTQPTLNAHKAALKAVFICTI